MIENIKMPPANFHFGGGLKTSSEVEKDVDRTVQTKQLSSKDVKNLTKELNNISNSLNTDIKFGFDDEIDEIYVTVMDKNTGRVIRKLPSEEAMKIKKSMKELVGSLLDKKV